MAQGEYSSANIKILEFDDVVRRRPGMYFGIALDDPRLPTRVLHHVIDHAVHPMPHMAGPHGVVVEVEILGDLAFVISDDQLCRPELSRVLEHGYFGSVLCSDRWALAAAAALSRRTVVEVWQDERGLRQELTGLRPVGPPESFTAPGGRGTTVTIELDPDLLRPGAAITTDIEAIGLCQSADCPTDAPQRVTVDDRRGGR